MERSQILDDIVKKIYEMKETEASITEDDLLDFRGAGLTSVEILTLIVYLEDLYGIEISDDELILTHYVYVKDLIDVVVDNSEKGI